jgi:hypothetical protein
MTHRCGYTHEANFRSHCDNEGLYENCEHRSSRANIKGPARAPTASIPIRHSSTSYQQPKPTHSSRRIIDTKPYRQTPSNTNNMPSLRTIALTLVASFTLAQAEHLRVVWSAGSWGAIGGPQGNGQNGASDDFAIIRDDGEAVYTDKNPGGYSSCFSTGDGRTFEICGDCWDSCFRFKCKSSLGGHPETCEVQDGSGIALDSNKGMTDTDFIGIAIGIDTTCVVEFESDGGGCPIDDGNGPLHGQGKSV